MGVVSTMSPVDVWTRTSVMWFSTTPFRVPKGRGGSLFPAASMMLNTPRPSNGPIGCDEKRRIRGVCRNSAFVES
jgi:hypothetical protein